jgi:hypothetical protein
MNGKKIKITVARSFWALCSHNLRAEKTGCRVFDSANCGCVFGEAKGKVNHGESAGGALLQGQKGGGCGGRLS